MSHGRLVLILSMVALLGALTQFAVTPLLSEIASDLRVSVALVGQAVTVTFVAGATLGLLVGPIADHYGQRRLLLIGAFIASLSLLAGAVSPDYGPFLISRVPAGLGGAMMVAIAIAIASTRLPENERRAGIGWIFTAFSATAVLGFPFMTEIGERTSWRGSMVALSLMILIAMAMVWVLVSPDANRSSARLGVRQAFGAYATILRSNAALLLQATNFVRTVSAFAVVTYLGAYLTEEFGVSLTNVGYAYVVCGVGYLVGTRLGDGRMFSLSFRAFQSLTAVVFGAMFCVPFLFGFGPLWTIVFVSLGSVAMSAGFVSLTILISEETPTVASTALMLRQSGFGYGTAAAGGVGGLVLAVSDFAAFGLVVLALSLFAALATQWVPGRQHRARPAELPGE